MRMKVLKNIGQIIAGFSVLLLVTACGKNIENAEVKSPDGKIVVQMKEKSGKLFYAVQKNGIPILEESGVGFELKDDLPLESDFKIVGIGRKQIDEIWEQPWGESRYVKNNCNELIVKLQEKGELQRKMNVIFRVFNDGFGFRYEFPEQPNLNEFVILDEKTEYHFPRKHMAWWIPTKEPYYESIARHTAIDRMDTVNTPLTLETADGMYLAIHEANLTDYAKMSLYATDSTTLSTWLAPWSNGVKVYAKTPFVTPWRTMIIGEKPGDLVVSNLMLNLNEPSKIIDFSWIKPGKYIGIWWALHMGRYTWYAGPKHGATTALTKRYIDFAAKHNFLGVLVEGWNVGWEGNWMKRSDSIRFTEAYPDFDIQEITDYAASKGVQLIGHHETAANTRNYERQMEDAFAYYQKYGVHNVKTGYVNVLMDGKELHDGQYGVRHYRKVIETAAKYHICIDNHEPVMPTGLQRTWPNLMTQEGVRGQEHNAWSPDGGNIPEHTTVVPFLRGVAGPMDFTFGTFNFENKAYPGTRVQTTLVKQLALFVVIYSPLQMASDLPENYEGIKAFDFIRDVPTDWQETRVLDAGIGDYSVFARKDRNSEDWYVGCITDENARNLTVDLSFLDKNVTYLAQIYSDGENADWKMNPTAVKYEERQVTAADRLEVSLATSGGCAVRFVKQETGK